MGLGSISGSVRLTADSTVGTASSVIRVYNATWLSGTTAGNLVLRNGAADSADVYVQASGDADNTQTINFENGLRFPNGCFFDKDTNVTFALIEYTKEQ